ncbi:MAG TPA: HDOD domain-containing protein [Terracidiphilus sp.]|jgi:EAL and modified HD-GYP domain-containing signal transduction protein|nr:HDOD domain-containing protein [Terracidiphilus sp.]
MAPSACIAAPEAEEGGLAGSLRYLARQPILDLRGRVIAYELLFRSGPENVSDCGDGDFATRTMLDNSILFGLEKLARGLPAFVNCTSDVITQEQVLVLPPSMTVLEIRETVQPTPELIRACQHLKFLGFRFALDDFVWQPSLQPLVSLADYIKVDFLKSSAEDRRRLLARLPADTTLIAEKVQNRADFEIARTEGFSLFQGYYFCAPAMVRAAKIPANKIFHVQLLQLLQDDPIDLRRLGELVKRDAGLTYRLLRLVNSPACAIRQEVRSIELALMAVGDNLFRRIASLAIASELNSGESSEILRMAFIRARFCELAAPLCALDPGEQYLIGLFSMLPAMLKVPMSEVLLALPIRRAVQDALLGQSGAVRGLLEWLEAEERGDWQCSYAIALASGAAPGELISCYSNATLWADESLPALEAVPGNLRSAQNKKRRCLMD